jgi:hypothetical protein
VICYYAKKHMAMLFRIQSRREVVDTSHVFITTTIEATGLISLEDVSTPPLVLSLDGAIELSTKEHLLATAKF